MLWFICVKSGPTLFHIWCYGLSGTVSALRVTPLLYPAPCSTATQQPTSGKSSKFSDSQLARISLSCNCRSRDLTQSRRNVPWWGLQFFFLYHNAQNRCSLAGLRGDVCSTSERGQEQELGGGVPRASLARGTSLLGCAAGSALQRPQPHARGPGPAASSWASLEGSKLAIRGRPRPAPAVRGKSRIQRLLMPRESLPEVGDSSTWAALPQSREGHRPREEGTAGLGGRRRGHVLWRRARDEPFLSMWRRPDWARTTAVPPPHAAGS